MPHYTVQGVKCACLSGLAPSHHALFLHRYCSPLCILYFYSLRLRRILYMTTENVRPRNAACFRVPRIRKSSRIMYTSRYILCNKITKHTIFNVMWMYQIPATLRQPALKTDICGDLLLDGLKFTWEYQRSLNDKLVRPGHCALRTHVTNLQEFSSNKPHFPKLV